MPLRVQLSLAEAGFSTLRLFANIADSKKDLRELIKTDLGVEPIGAENKRIHAAVLSAWDGAKELAQKESELRAEARVLGERRPPTIQERASMRRLVETSYGPISDKDAPSNEYLAAKLEEIEQEEPRAAPLDEITSLEDADGHSMHATLDNTGRVRILRQRPKGRPPANSEELRRKLRIEQNTFAFLAAKFTGKTWLQGLTPRTWSDYVDYILGENVYQLKLPSESGDANPSWTVVLSYEHECRKWAFKQVREGRDCLVGALARVAVNSELRDVHFITPVLVALRSRSSSSGEPARKYIKGAGKGTFKGQAKGKKKQGNMPDGKQICFAFNSDNGCSQKDCQRAHNCRVCLGNHSMVNCPKMGQAKSN